MLHQLSLAELATKTDAPHPTLELGGVSDTLACNVPFHVELGPW